MSRLVALIQSEPALIAALVQALVMAATQFGLPITRGQAGAIDTLTLALLAVIVRQTVTPKANP